MSCLQAVIHFVSTRRYVRYQTIFNDSNDELFTRQGWCICENTRFPPMWLGLDYESRRHICGLSCWFSTLHREVFLRPFRFSPVLKNQHFNWFALIVNFILLCFSWQCPNICFRSRTTRHFIKVPFLSMACIERVSDSIFGFVIVSFNFTSMRQSVNLKDTRSFCRGRLEFWQTILTVN